MLKRFLQAVVAVMVLASCGAGCKSNRPRGMVSYPPRKPYTEARPAAPAPRPAASPVTNAAATAQAARPAAPSAVPAAAPAATPAARPATASADVSVYRLKPGDPIFISLRGIPGGDQQIEDQIDENGTVTLPFINTVQAAGRTSSELEQAIRRAYLDQQIFKHITVNVVIAGRSYFVYGEVRSPGRFALGSGVTVLQAIAGAGGYTEFANKGRVEILRGSKVIELDARQLEKNPEKDVAVESGDQVIVRRSMF